MRIFKTAEAMASEISDMQTSEGPRREDRATVSSFFNGAPPLSDAEAEEMGLNVNVNNLFGYTELAQAKEQTMALINQPPRLFEISLDRAPASQKQRWEMAAAAKLNKVIQRSGRFKPSYEGVAGDSVMHGSASFSFRDNTDWCPSHVSASRLLIPDSSPADQRKLTHWGIETELEMHEIFTYYRLEAPGWKRDALGKIIKAFRDKERKDDSTISEVLDATNIEEWEYQQQTNSGKTSFSRVAVQVYYFFQIQPDKVTRPVDLTILARYKQADKDSTTSKPDDIMTEIMFDQDEYYPSVEDALHPFFMDCIIGGSSKWHRVLGLGTLNYSLNWAVELLMNRAMQATHENMMTLWQAGDAADREELAQLMLRHNMIVPEHVTLAPNRIPADLEGALAMIQQYRSQGSKNAMAQAVNAPAVQPKAGGRQLEQQFLAEQAQIGAAQGNRTANWYDYFDRLATKMVERFTNPFITKYDPGYSDIINFQSAMQALGIPLYYLQPHNIEVKVARVVGAGSRSKAQAASASLKQALPTLPPGSQAKAKRMILAIDLDDYGLAEDLMPIQDHPDTSQTLRAQTEENTAIVQGKAPPVNDDDIDALHLQSHTAAMATMAQKGAKAKGGAFTPDQHQAFIALGGHVAAHINKLQATGDKKGAKAWMDQLNKLASAGEKLAHNMQQTQPQGPQLDPKDAVAASLKAAQLKLQQQKFQHTVKKTERQQQLREHTEAVHAHVALSRENREDRKTRQEMTVRDLETARKLTSPAAFED